MRSQPAAPAAQNGPRHDLPLPPIPYHYLIGPTTEGAKEVRERPNSR